MSEDNKALVPVEEKTVDFYGDQITAVLVDDEIGGTVYVPVRPICDFLGFAWSPQRRRINREPILAEMLTSVTFTVKEAGQTGQMLCLR